MKRIITLIIILCVLCTITPSLFAASTQTESIRQMGRLYEYTVSWTAHTDGSYTSYLLRYPIDGILLCVVTDPGATAPQAAYDPCLTDQYGRDVMGGGLADRSATATEMAMPQITGAAGLVPYTVPVHGCLQLAITGNNVNTALGKVIIYFKRLE